jgi:uncharacterized protein YlaI
MIQNYNVQCIICDKENNATSIEHIVSEAFGNKFYVAPQGRVCDECNNRFSKFEGVALSNSMFIMERARYGIATKRGKNAKGKVDNIEIQGHEEFEKNRITVKGLTPDNFKSFNPLNGTGELFIKSFDKSEVACSKLLLKMALPAIFVSQYELFQKYDFTDLKEFLTNKNTYDWPFVTSIFDIAKFESIPTFTDKYNLKLIRCSLKYCELNEQTLLFKFTYGGISMVINLLNRSLDWAEQYLNSDSKSILYPDHFRKKLQVVK